MIYLEKQGHISHSDGKTPLSEQLTEAEARAGCHTGQAATGSPAPAALGLCPSTYLAAFSYRPR